ncbi:hypothetical protein C8Q74DRAFT_353057 [Fomes fomentarius]|nr:hypothetical protein C8Q74DRAFT_353057 [Fomes fomentarius]
MSISTEAFGSYLCRACSSDTLQNAPVQIEKWKKELAERVHTYGGTVDSYLDTFVPSSAPQSIPSQSLKSAYSTFNPTKGNEVRGYEGLLKGLRRTVYRFPAAKKPTFFPNHRSKLLFPFEPFQHNHHSTFPDIAMSLPGYDLTEATWARIATFFEVKAEANDDPFDKDGLKHCDTLIQMAIDARGLIVTHGFLTAFVVGIYGPNVRIVRYDHSGVVAAPSFSLKEQPELFQKFLWRFVHPVVGDTVVGCDPTSRKLTDAEVAWVQGRLRDAGEPPLRQPSLCRRSEVYSTHDEGEVPRSFFLIRLIDINARLLSRATTVWMALEDPRKMMEGIKPEFPTVDTLEFLIVKDAWRQLVRKDEKMFYDRLQCTISNEDWTGLPRLVCGGDLGERETAQWKARGGSLHDPIGDPGPSTVAHRALFPLPPKPPTTPNHSTSALSFSSPLTPLTPSSPIAPMTPARQRQQTSPLSSPLTEISDATTPDGPLDVPQQQTYTWRNLFGDTDRHRERSHMRFVIDTVGRRLTRFRSTKELVRALHDAIKGHKLAWEKGKLLHRDVSVGNILIVDKIDTREYRGFLHDFDYSSMAPLDQGEDVVANGMLIGSSSSAMTMTSDPSRTTDIADLNEDLKERAGTLYFMAVELLMPTSNILHNVHHDIESFYWVLIWVVFRHTAHTHRLGDAACAQYFKLGSDTDSHSGKLGLLMELFVSGIVVKDNAPLSLLISTFTKLVQTSLGLRCAEPVPLTHDAVLALFEEVLEMDWPEGDAALPVTLPDTRTDVMLNKVSGPKPSADVPKEASRKRREKPHDDPSESTATGSSKRSKKSTDGGPASSTGTRSSKRSKNSVRR